MTGLMPYKELYLSSNVARFNPESDGFRIQDKGPYFQSRGLFAFLPVLKHVQIGFKDIRVVIIIKAF